jgi:parallel beta-helix repeat protein
MNASKEATHMTRIIARRRSVGAAAGVGLLVLAAGPALAVECGETITGDARLDRDLICTTDPGLTVTGGLLDLNGFTVVCDHDPTVEGVGVLLDGSGARLRGGAVTGCFVAVHVAGEGGHTVRRLTASASNQGVFVESDGNRLLDSQILRGLEDAAVQVDGSDNLLRGNAIAGSDDQGFEINGNDNRIVRNRIGGVAEGVQLEGERNHVLRNQIVGATDRGIDVRGLVEPTGAHVMFGNLIVDGVDGIALLESSNGNRISRNTIYGNSDQGIFVGTFDNTIQRNQALLNRVDLQDSTPGCDDNLWRGNTFETSVSDDCIE